LVLSLAICSFLPTSAATAYSGHPAHIAEFPCHLGVAEIAGSRIARCRRPARQLGNIFAELSVIMLRSILQTTSKNNDRKIDAERFEGHPTKWQQLEARIERLRQDANGMSDREAAARLMMQTLALEVQLD
jgi:hypothetical protein